ncbi:tetratricopeptide repeat protein, partial [Paramuribaculum intestinale]
MRINAMNRTLLLIITTIAIIACGCTRQQPSDPRLQRLTLSVDTGPQAAIDSLAAIDPATLGDYDRHYYNFLTVKARDKAYIVHTSDSLILDVINHFGRSPKMAEALYYAGRVYSDLGDYPTALRYFHDALDRISDDPEDNNILRASIASQTARLMLNLR